MSSQSFTSLCGEGEDVADCVTKMTSLVAQVNHWKIGTFVFVGVLVLLIFSLGYGYIIINNRCQIKSNNAGADDVEKNRLRTVVDATCSRPFVIAVEDHNEMMKTSVRVVDITPRKTNCKLYITSGNIQYQRI